MVLGFSNSPLLENLEIFKTEKVHRRRAAWPFVRHKPYVRHYLG